MAVVVQRAKLGGELRDDRRNERDRKRRNQSGIDQRVESPVRGDPELTAGNGMRREAAHVEHRAGSKDEKALLNDRAGPQPLESTPQQENARWTHTTVHRTVVLMKVEN